MRRTAIVTALLLLLASVAPATATAQTAECNFPVERTDATGATVEVAEEPQRVVTLNPSAAQTLWEMDAQEKVVGVTKHAMNLDGASEKENISGAGETINNEEVVGLEPDLVLAPNTVGNDTVDALREADLTVYRFEEAKSVEAVYEKTRLIGELTGECEAAENTVSWMQERLAVVDETVEGEDRPDILYTFYGYTAGNDTFIHSMMERAGTDNVAADANVSGYAQLNDEIIVERNPEWLLYNDDEGSWPQATPAYNSTTAMQENQTVVVNKNHLNRPGPRVVLAIEEIASTVHADAYAEANGSQAAGDAAETTATGEDGTGLTALTALVATLAGALVAARRVA